MDMPKPGPEHRHLEALAGSWSGDETIAPSPWDPVGGTARARIQNRIALDGFALIQDYEQERHGAVTFRGHGVLRWAAEHGQYVFHWFDSLGTPPGEFRGPFESGRLVLVSRGPTGNARATFDLTQPGRYQFLMDVSPDGTRWFPFMNGTYRREA